MDADLRRWGRTDGQHNSGTGAGPGNAGKNRDDPQINADYADYVLGIGATGERNQSFVTDTFSFTSRC
jgi:hypothetical protein